jgi:NADPH:quinone reductase-like Zn-dependent oxidoreductase
LPGSRHPRALKAFPLRRVYRRFQPERIICRIKLPLREIRAGEASNKWCSMKVAQFSSFGDPASVIECVDVPDPPQPNANEVALDVIAFPINPADLLTIEGRYAIRPQLPSRVGAECVGRVTAVGEAVKHLQPGDLVIPLDRDNWVQRKVSRADRLIKVPSDLDPLQLAMLKVNPPTAYLMMKKYAHLAPGDWLLQTAANSGVGHCLISLAHAEGVKTVNIVRREGIEQELYDLGADVVLVDGPDLAERIAAATGGAPIRLAIDAVGGSQIVRLGDALADEAVVVNYGRLSGENPQLSGHQCVFKRLWLTGFWLVPWLQKLSREEVSALYAKLAVRIADGTIHVPVQATFPIEDIGQAVALANGYHRSGKVLVTPNGPPAMHRPQV